MAREDRADHACRIAILASGPAALSGLFETAPKEGAVAAGPAGSAARLTGETEAVGFDLGTFVYDVVVSFSAAVPAGVLATWICGKLAGAKGLQAVEIDGCGVNLEDVEDVAEAIRRARLG